MEKNYSIKEENVIEIEVENSKFIGVLQRFSSKNELFSILEDIKKRYPKARHYCYAYRLNDEFKYSDDGEPSGTAGKPIYGILENANLINVILVVVRYFGGTLLGSGRLLRTYAKCAKETVDTAKILPVLKKAKYRIEIDIDQYNNFISYCNKQAFVVLNTYFNDTIIVDFLTDPDFKEDLESIFLKKLKIIGKIEIDYMEGT